MGTLVSPTDDAAVDTISPLCIKFVKNTAGWSAARNDRRAEGAAVSGRRANGGRISMGSRGTLRRPAGPLGARRIAPGRGRDDAPTRPRDGAGGAAVRDA